MCALWVTRCFLLWQMTSSEDERYSCFWEEHHIAFRDEANLPGRDPVGTRHGRSSYPHHWAVSSPRHIPHCRHHSQSAHPSESHRERNPQHGRRSRWDQHTRHHQLYSAGHRASQHQSQSEVWQPCKDGPKDVSRNPSGSRRVSHTDLEGVAARRGNPGERQR